MARFRLRFQHQEVDLRRPVTYIGRSDECDISIADPLVSRRHARIAIDGDSTSIEDLSSRNGLFVNGEPIYGQRPLAPEDRIRAGSIEFVFCRAGLREDRWSDTTGVIRVCGACGALHARDLVACPACGTVGAAETDPPPTAGEPTRLRRG